ncbi:hypothetical protein BC835DRAFT_272326 [Cytidiella melzeri]|nr:hypothetical protein BC835DRAFT_272326 [Cytidiella melzeri]
MSVPVLRQSTVWPHHRIVWNPTPAMASRTRKHRGRQSGTASNTITISSITLFLTREVQSTETDAKLTQVREVPDDMLRHQTRSLITITHQMYCTSYFFFTSTRALTWSLYLQESCGVGSDDLCSWPLCDPLIEACGLHYLSSILRSTLILLSLRLYSALRTRIRSSLNPTVAVPRILLAFIDDFQHTKTSTIVLEQPRGSRLIPPPRITG